MRTGALRGMILGRGHTASPQVPRESLYQDSPGTLGCWSPPGGREKPGIQTQAPCLPHLSAFVVREILVSKASDPDFSLYNRIHRAREG